MRPQANDLGSAFHLIEATIDSIHRAMAAGQITCRQLAELYLARVDAYDHRGPNLTSFQTVNPAAYVIAARLDAAFRATGPVGPLHGIPVLVKDQLETRDMPTTYGSALFKDFVPNRNAAVVDRLLAAGALILAKNTMSEYATPGYHGSAFGFSRNPYDPTRSPGGSSCGTGVSVAANLGVVGVGEDTGGSIRNPASLTGIVGLRPTLGLVSRFGMLPGTPSRDTLGPMARTVRDAAILLDVLAGYDPRDPITAYAVGHIPASYTTALVEDGLQGLRLGVIREYIAAGVDAEADDHRQIRAAIDRALSDMANGGAEIVDPIPLAETLDLLRQPLAGGETEAAIDSYLAAHPNAPVKTLRDIVLADGEMVHPSHRAQLLENLGHTTNDAGHLHMLLTREQIRQQVFKAMADHNVDVLIYPTFEHSPPVIPADILTSPASQRSRGGNSALSPAIGFPALTMPAGFTTDGLPIGISFLGRPFSEALLFRVAYAFEQRTSHRRPPPTTPALPGEP